MGDTSRRIGNIRRRIGIVSTYPPTQCGLATFAAALGSALQRAGDDLVVVAVDDGRTANAPRALPIHTLVNGSASSRANAARLLADTDTVILQHEYGIYGGRDGDEVVELLREIAVPVVVVLHTVLAAPSEHQRAVLEQVCDLAARVVVMTNAARDRLTAGFVVDHHKIVTIPHGASTIGAGAPAGPARPLRLLTWGLLGPGKGIEHLIRAMALLQDLHPKVVCTIAGATHPNVFARVGDTYRHGLIREAWSRGVVPTVRFDDAYRDVAGLARLISTSSVVVLPYDSTDQVTSGVLVDAIAAGRPVIATDFPHAVELLSDGAGIIVPHRDPFALAAAIRSVALDDELLASMSARARAIAPSLGWQSVADSYRTLCDELSVEVVR